jgi:hypothetical protein
MFWNSRNEEIERLKRRVEDLERHNSVLLIAIQGIQTNLLSATQAQADVAKNVKDIQDFIQDFVQQAILYEYDPSGGYEH